MDNELRSGLDDFNSAPRLDHELDRLRRLVRKSGGAHLTQAIVRSRAVQSRPQASANGRLKTGSFPAAGNAMEISANGRP